jgi:hypothetical protein
VLPAMAPPLLLRPLQAVAILSQSAFTSTTGILTEAWKDLSYRSAESRQNVPIATRWQIWRTRDACPYPVANHRLCIS